MPDTTNIGVRKRVNGKRTQLLKDKVALVTGSSSGIGAGIIRLFAEHGAKAALHSRDMSTLAAVQWRTCNSRRGRRHQAE